MTHTCAELFQGMECTIIGNGDEEVTGLSRSEEHTSELQSPS